MLADIIFTPASFNTAYRAYAVENGQDAALGTQKAQDAANQNSGAAALAQAEATDAVFISPQAARLYAKQVTLQKRVNAVTKTLEDREAAGSTSAESSDRLPNLAARVESEDW